MGYAPVLSLYMEGGGGSGGGGDAPSAGKLAPGGRARHRCLPGGALAVWASGGYTGVSGGNTGLRIMTYDTPGNTLEVMKLPSGSTVVSISPVSSVLIAP